MESEKGESVMKNIFKTPSIIRLAVLTVLQALFVAFHGHLLIVVLYLPAILVLVGIIAEYALPFLMGFFAADNGKWWLLSLPIQLAADVGIQYASNIAARTFTGKVTYALLFLTLQAVGVGVKLLYLEMKSRRSSPKT